MNRGLKCLLGRGRARGGGAKPDGDDLREVESQKEEKGGANDKSTRT
jgi:hypothetical protein